MLLLIAGLRVNHAVQLITTGSGVLSERARSIGVMVTTLRVPDRLNRYGGELRTTGVFGLAASGRALGGWSVRFGAWLRESRADVLVVNDLRSLLLASIGARLACVPIVWSVRDDNRQGRWHPIGARLAAKIVLVSHGTRKVFTERELAWASKKMSVIHNGIPFPQPLPEARKILRRQLGFALDNQAPVVIHVGMLAERKGHADLFKAVADDEQLKKLNVHVVIVGDEPIGHLGHASHLKSLANSLGIADRVHWLGYREDAVDLIAGSDLLVLPSFNEGLPGVLIESLAVGVPVVAYKVAGAEEIVDSGRTGAIVPVGDVGELATAIANWLTDDALRAEAARVAPTIMHERFSLERYVREYEQVLQGTVYF